MKKNFIKMITSVSLLTMLLFSTIVNAADLSSTKDIPIGGSGQMEMVGIIEPTILSVTIPSIVPFSMGNSLPTENKVISPRVIMKNNSNIPVEIDVVYTKVNLDNLNNVQWSNDGIVSDTGIAVGFKQEEVLDEMPETLSNAMWLAANSYQNLKVLTLNATTEDAVYVVGTLGANVSENSTFTVTPTFVVKKTTISGQ